VKAGSKQKLKYVYSSLRFIRMMKVKRMDWKGNLTCIGGIRNKNTILEEKSEVKG
jgi:hypothetical protein